MRSVNRILAVVLSLVLCVGLAAPAFAASFDDLQDAINGNTTKGEATSSGWGYAKNESGSYGIETSTGENGERNVKLNEDVKHTNTDQNDHIEIKDNNNVNIDLNGNSITGDRKGGYTDGMIEVKDGGSLTVTDSGSDGKIENTGTADTVLVGENGSVTLEDGTITTDTGVKSVMVKDGGEFTMNGGELTGGTENTLTVMGNGSTVTLNGGEVERNNGGAAVSGQQEGKIIVAGDDVAITNKAGAGLSVNNDAEAVISGGTITGSDGGVTATNGSKLELTGGTIHSEKQPTDENPHADIELSNAAADSTLTIRPGVKFETMGIRGEENEAAPNTGTNTIVVQDKDGNEVYQIIYAPGLGLTITDPDVKLHDVAKDKPVTPGQQTKDWQWIYLGPDAVNYPYGRPTASDADGADSQRAFTRGDAIGCLWLRAGSPDAELSGFQDVPENHQWAVAIGWAKENGIAVADLDGNFRPDDPVLRGVESLETKPEGELQEFLDRCAVAEGIELAEGEHFCELDGAVGEVVTVGMAQAIFNTFFAKLDTALKQAA